MIRSLVVAAALPLHEHCLFKLGVNLGELWHLTPLATWSWRTTAAAGLPRLLVVTEGMVTVRSAGRSIDVPAGSGLWMAASDPGVVVAAHSPAAEFFRTLVGGH